MNPNYKSNHNEPIKPTVSDKPKPASNIGDIKSVNNEPVVSRNPKPTRPTYATDTASSNQPKKSDKKNEIKNTIYTIMLFILAPVFAIFMIIFVLQSYVVDGSSMTPTLQNANRVFILKLPETMAKLQHKSFIPARHEIIVFKKPSEPDTQLIKRVIGLPGDRVVVKDNTVRVYNAQNPDGFDPDANTEYGSKLAQIDTGNQITDITVGQNELFVLGDNRTPGGSLDSHTGLGLVPAENIVGRLWLRYYPINEFKIFATTPILGMSDIFTKAQPKLHFGLG